ncbi:hypothetical protein LTR86_007077 [Recurvomyces mirabilis]|nr:hypothetical protein LTR86_007077 [Recurvomyces mirabilis]
MVRNRLLALPAELRNLIYKLVLISDTEATELVCANPPSKALLLCCRATYQEARLIYRHAFRDYWRHTLFFIQQDGPCTFDHLREEDIEHIENVELHAIWTPPQTFLVRPRDLTTLLWASLGCPVEPTAFIAKRDRDRQLWFCAFRNGTTKPCRFPTRSGIWELGVTVVRTRECRIPEGLVLQGVMRPLEPSHPLHFLRSLVANPKVKVFEAPPRRRELEAILKLGK